MEFKQHIKELPLFPLELVLLPFEELPLHIFESRYKRMVSNSINKNKSFGIVYRSDNDIFEFGCIAKVSKVVKTYAGGESDIIVKGFSRFQITDTFYKDDLSIGKVKIFNDYELEDIKKINEIHDNYLKILLKLGITNTLDKDLDKKKSFEFIQKILLPVHLKKILISNNNEEDRIAIINEIFTKILHSPIDDINEMAAIA